MIPRTLIDTDVIIELTRRHPAAVHRAAAYLISHPHLSISIVTQFEVLRGLQLRGTHAEIAQFTQFCRTNEVVPLSGAVVVRAAGIYADLHRRGLLISDADILIGATAMEHGLTLATNNQSHFSRIPGLTVDNWLVP